MNDFRKKHAIAYSAIAVALGIGLALLVNLLLEAALAAHVPGVTGPVLAITVELVPIAVSIAFLAATGKTSLLRPRAAGFGRGLACGAAFIVLSLALGLVALNYAIDGGVQVAPDVVLKTLVYFALTGVSEEFLARAVSGETLLEHFGLTHGGIVKACVVSGFIFGAMHAANLAIGIDAPSVLVQMVSAAGMGMVFGAIYFRCGNIWPCVLVHALWDLALQAATSARDYGAASAASPVGGGNLVGGALFFAFFVLLALFLLRKGKISQVQQAWADAVPAE